MVHQSISFNMSRAERCIHAILDGLRPLVGVFVLLAFLGVVHGRFTQKQTFVSLAASVAFGGSCTVALVMITWVSPRSLRRWALMGYLVVVILAAAVVAFSIIVLSIVDRRVAIPCIVAVCLPFVMYFGLLMVPFQSLRYHGLA